MADFTGQVAVVTGGASGLGLATVEVLHAAGASVTICDRDVESGTAIADRLNRERDGSARFLPMDVADPASVIGVFEQIPRLDVLVNSAGVRQIGDALTLDAAEWNRVVAVNLSGTFFCAQQAALKMKVAGGGVIINIASVAGLLAIRPRPAYVATKHAVVGLTKALATELGEHSIRVNAVAPGVLRTKMTESYYDDPAFLAGLDKVVPLARRGSSDDVARAIAFLASADAPFVTGVILPVDGGWSAEKTYSPSPSPYSRG